MRRSVIDDHLEVVIFVYLLAFLFFFVDFVGFSFFFKGGLFVRKRCVLFSVGQVNCVT